MRFQEILISHYILHQRKHLSPTVTPLPHTRPTPRVSLRNCCHHRHITLYAKPPYSVKTMRLAQYAQTAPLSHILRFIPFFVTSKPHSPHVSGSEEEYNSSVPPYECFSGLKPEYFNTLLIPVIKGFLSCCSNAK